jgi:hypothetical protein
MYLKARKLLIVARNKIAKRINPYYPWNINEESWVER